MRELGDRLRLAQEAGGLDVVGVGVGAQDLDRDLSVELGIVRRVDLAHPAAADQMQQAVAADRRAGAGAFDG